MIDAMTNVWPKDNFKLALFPHKQSLDQIRGSSHTLLNTSAI